MHGCSAYYNDRPQAEQRGKLLKGLVDLDCELAGRHQNQAAPLFLGKALYDGDGKGKRLAGTGLRNSYDILALCRNRYRFILDRRRHYKLHPVKGLQNLRSNTQSVERYVCLMM